MFKKYSTLVLVAAGLIFVSCDEKNDKVKEQETRPHDGKITVSVGSKYQELYQLATVKAISFVTGYNDVEPIGDVIATSNFVNGGFTINLPLTVSDEFFKKLSDVGNVKSSNPNTKVALVQYLNVYNTEGKFVGYFQYFNFRQTKYGNGDIPIIAKFWYADSDVTIKDGNLSFSLKKGWNILYEVDASNEEINSMWWSFTVFSDAVLGVIN